jgi:hypothetical protein
LLRNRLLAAPSPGEIGSLIETCAKTRIAGADIKPQRITDARLCR